MFASGTAMNGMLDFTMSLVSDDIGLAKERGRCGGIFPADSFAVDGIFNQILPDFFIIQAFRLHGGYDV
jgi:hypothetical protein